MSDTFWVQLFGFLGVLALMYKTHLDALAKSKTLENKIDYGNELTASVAPIVVQQFDSATKENKEAAKITKDAAQTVAIDSAKGQELIVASVKDLASSIKGDDGTCVTARLKKLEDGHENLSKGQDELSRKMDALGELLKAVDSTVRKSSNF